MSQRIYRSHEPCADMEVIDPNLVGKCMQPEFTSPDVTDSRSLETNNSKLRDDRSANKIKCDAPKPKELTDLLTATFKKQPPDNLRKSNFFHFELSFYDPSGNVVCLEKASFIGFQDEKKDEKPLRNGIKYRLHFVHSSGKKQIEELLVRLIDSSSKKPISYDGQDKNPDMCKVLLTHEVMCSRCCENKSCGNRNETPSDPVILTNNTVSRYHMKCNQNCLKNAGNPRETRRFQVLISFCRNDDLIPLATSENMFVHNNSKHGRRPGSICDPSPLSNNLPGPKIPCIHHIIPREGKLSGCDEIAVIGEYFFDGLQIVFGNQMPYRTEFISPNIMKVLTPPCPGTIMVELKLVHGCRIIQKGHPCHFKYNADLFDSQVDYYIDKLWTIIPKQSSEIEKPSREIILRRVVDLFECLYIHSPVMYNSYENGYDTMVQQNPAIQQRMLTNIASTPVPSNIPSHSYAQNGKEGKPTPGSRPSAVSNNPVDTLSSNSEYIRSVMNNPNAPYESGNNNGGYIMAPLVLGVGPMCDPMAANGQSNFYLPYGSGPDSSNPLALNFPNKRNFSVKDYN